MSSENLLVLPWAKRPQDVSPPDGWQEVPLARIADIWFSSVDKKSYAGERPVRLCNYIDVYNNDYIRGDEDFMPATASNSEIARFAVEPGDVIITKDSETPDDIGIPAVVEESSPDLLCGYHLALIRPKQDQVDSVFLAKQLAHERVSRYFAILANGLTRYGLSTAVVENVPVWIPPLGEQQRVAEILKGIDETISKTEALIAKLKAIKQGLLQDLLSCGLNDNGQIRNHKRNPEQFKESPLGWIPTNWSVEKLGMAADKIQDGTHFSPKSTTGPFRYLTSKNVRFGIIDLTDCGWISEREHRSIYSRCDVRLGDVLLTKDGANTGNAAIYNLSEEASLLSSIAFIRCDNDKLHAQYLLQYFLSSIGQRRIKDLMSGVAITRLTVAKIRDFLIPVPEPNEQMEISSRLGIADCRLSAEDAYLSKLKAIKKGLMQDLLTGRMRIPKVMFETEGY